MFKNKFRVFIYIGIMDISNIKQDWIDFVNLYLTKGVTRVEAYQTIRPHTTYGSAAVGAHLLLKNPKIIELIKHRRNEMMDRLQLTVEDQAMELERVKKKLIKEEKWPDVIRAIEAQNKMLGLNAPEKSEVTHSVEQPLFGKKSDDD